MSVPGSEGDFQSPLGNLDTPFPLTGQTRGCTLMNIALNSSEDAQGVWQGRIWPVLAIELGVSC